MNKKKPGVDIVNDLLEDCIVAYPLSSFIISVYKQYQQAGSLSKKQLQGLYGKASKIPEVSPTKLGTLEAIIKKMPTRYKSALPPPAAAAEKDEVSIGLINNILEKYPLHKRVLFLKTKLDGDELLSTLEQSELKKFHQLLIK
ncbi:MAG: hypothetical protein ABI151_13325 [Chitinophagaceae bacterium]